MKTYLKNLNKILAISAVCLAPSSTFGAATETNAAPVEVVVPKSIFIDDAKIGKDPFYPKSTRRAERPPSPDQPVVAPITQLALKGISGLKNRRFALINNQTIGVGETATVKVGLALIKVHCWEIRENSVVISMEGNSEKKELRLRDS